MGVKTAAKSLPYILKDIFDDGNEGQDMPIAIKVL